jgi:hypothetical protein
VSDVAFLAACTARSRMEPPLFRRSEVMRLYALAGHRLSGHIPAWLTLRPAIVDSLVEMAQAVTVTTRGAAIEEATAGE